MNKIKIREIEQTENAGLFSICFEGNDETEFEKFILKFKDDAERKQDLQVILNVIRKMLSASGFLERFFRPEGKMNDHVVALPIERGKLRLYCLRMSDSILIVGNGGIKATKTYDDDTDLCGYVITLQKLDVLLKDVIRKGIVSIEGTNITGIENTFEL
ncbi:MAG: hypothetical protein MJY75_05490 [Bacteroidaceae bacterium]|nr:hypothetical protein [Bacteroidaceae bacterium]